VSVECLPNIDLAALTGNSVYTWGPKSQVVFDQPEETRNFLVRQAYQLDVVSGQYSAVEYGPNIGQEDD
jgi:hypothetical protein